MLNTGNFAGNNLTGLGVSRFAVKVAVTALGLTMVLGMSTASARDRTKPTAPKNFRVTAKTSYSISLAWSPSTDNFRMKLMIWRM